MNLIKTNICSRDKIYSFLTVQMYVTYTSFSGQTYCDSYSKEVFTKFKDEEFSYEVVFYSGFAVLLGSIVGTVILNRIPRKEFILSAYMLQLISIYLLTIAMYFQWIYIAAACNLTYSFFLYYGLASVFVFPNEVAQPFIVGIGYAMNWVAKSLIGLVLP